MLIGLTYDLRQDYLAQGYSLEEVAEYDSLETIEALHETLVELGHRVTRVGSLPRLAGALLAGKRWDLVFNIAEGRGGYGREAQVPALLDYHGVPYTFSDPLTLALTLHKGMAKKVARDSGVATPDFAVVDQAEQAGELDLPFPLFAKPVAEGTGRGVGPTSKAKDRPELVRVCRELLQSHRQPVLVETYLPGREFTVGIMGTGAKAKALATMEVLFNANAEADTYTLQNKELCDQFVEYRLVDGPMEQKAREVALAAWRALECRDAGRVDLRCDEQGNPQFLEVNPLAGLHPHHSDLPILCGLAGISFEELIGGILESAVQRVGKPGNPGWAGKTPAGAGLAGARVARQ